ncbi:hypothetical protein ABZX88_35430 [Kitasatospora aureofaciens]|uniref:hypothetical protein n=1 Tax=Kitasatospora aureofaciens TaxID=1894 RepID=UPI0033AAB551
MSDPHPQYDRPRAGWMACAYGAVALGILTLGPSLPSLHHVAVLGGYSGTMAWLWVMLPVGAAVVGLLTVMLLLTLGSKIRTWPVVMLAFGFAAAVGADGYDGATTAMWTGMAAFPLATLAAILATGRAVRLGVFK